MNRNASPSPGYAHADAQQELLQRAKALRLSGLVTHWDEVSAAPWLPDLLRWEEQERGANSMQRRLARSRIGVFKPIADFDWRWPKVCDRGAIEELLSLQFMSDRANAILIGPNGIGKTTIARNIAYQAVCAGYTVLFVTAADMLATLTTTDSASIQQRRLRAFASFDLLCIDEVGYLSYSNQHADLLFELLNKRYEKKSTLVTTNRAFSQWHEVFPNAACVVSMIDRLVHNAEVIGLEGDSFRLKEAQERSNRRKARRTGAAS